MNEEEKLADFGRKQLQAAVLVEEEVVDDSCSAYGPNFFLNMCTWAGGRLGNFKPH